MKKYFHNIILLLLLFACSETNHPTGSPDVFIPQRAMIATSRTSLVNYGISDPVGVSKHGNTLSVSQLYSSHNVSVINLSDHSIQEWIPTGSEPDQAARVANLTTDHQGNITAFDFQTGRLFRYASTPNSRSAAPTSRSLTENTTPISAVQGDGFVISTGLYEQGRYCYYSLGDHSTNYFLSYPVHPDYPEMSEFTKSVLYMSNVMQLRPDNKAFVCADMRSGQIDICSINGKNIELACRHNYYYPHVQVDEDNTQVAYYKDNVNGFIDVAVSNDRVYLLYSGKTYRDVKQNISQCETLLVFDWEGTLLGTRTLPESIVSLSFDTVEGALYGITSGATLIKFDMESI